MRYILFLFSFFIFLNSAKANEFKVKGMVLDSLSESTIENATVQLLLENKIIKSELSKYDGSFNFSVVKLGNYLLTVSHLGYKTVSLPIIINENIFPEITIKLQLDLVNLNEVTVKANKPLVSQKNGEITYQIEGGIWQNSGNILSIIKRIPILKGRSGSNYLLYGSKVTFLIDGKPVESDGINLETVLSNLGSSEIDKIEILQSPPPSLARFGNPIVNIRTIKMKEDGSLFNLNHGFGQGMNNRFNNSAKYTLKKQNLLLGMAFTQSQVNQLAKSTSIKQSPNFLFNDLNQVKSQDDIYNLKMNLEYSKNKFGTLNFTADHKDFRVLGHKNSKGNYNILDKTEAISLLSNSISNGIQNLAGIDYNKKFSEKININSSIEIGQYKNENAESINLNRFGSESNFTNPWSRKINFSNYYLENASIFGHIKLTEGIFLKKSESLTKYSQNIGTPNNKENSFNYSENNFYSFVSSNYSKNNIDITLGLNLEKTNVKGFNSTNTTNLNFYSFLPNFTVNYKFDEVKTITFSYNRGISRPNYEWLNQQELYINPYSKSVGGGVLQPTIFNKISISNIFKNGLSLTGIYANQKNRYSFFPLLNANNQVDYSAINIKNFYYLYYSASFQKYFTRIWYFAADVSGYYSNLNSPNFGIKNSGYTQQLAISNYFTFKKMGQFGLTSSYNSTDYADSYQFLPQFSLNIEYSKSIFKKKSSINISYSDLTNSLKDRFEYQLNNFSVKDSYKYETRLFKLAINYQFGNKSVKTATEKSPKSEIERLK